MISVSYTHLDVYKRQIQYSLGRHTYMPGIAADFTCRNLSRLDEATRFTAVAEIRAHLNRYGEQEPYPRLWHSLSRVLTSGKIKEDDRRKERMPILQPLESMERISRQVLADDLDTVLERISREDIGLVITEEGKDDLVLCPEMCIRDRTWTMELDVHLTFPR